MALKPFSLCTITNSTPSSVVYLSPSPVALRHQACKHTSKKIACLATTQLVDHAVVTRRSANYEASLWDYDFVQSLKSNFNGEEYVRQAKQLKEEVRRLFEEYAILPLEKLEVIDTVQRLGLGYLFEKEIKEAVKTHSISCRDDNMIREDLHATALQFRLLRQHGFAVSEDVFNRFKDENGSFKECLGKDSTKGILSLYEASYLGFPEEIVLDEARDFSIRHLNAIKHKTEDKKVSSAVEHALEFPLQWRVERFEARWYISVYENEEGMNPKLLQLAKLDYNQTQALYQANLQAASRWWKEIGLGNKMSFSRDRLVESCLWAIAIASEPQLGHERAELTKYIQLITTLDDVYDVYGSVHELQHFTDAVDRWALSAMEQLPEYMQLCYLALFNTVNIMGYEALKEEGLYIIPYLKRMWADLCKADLVEAEWFSKGYTPGFEEYLNNALVSVSGPLMIVFSYFLSGQKITKEALQILEGNIPDLIRFASIIFRISDDMGTSTAEIARGDVSKAVQCYMREKGVTEEVARQHLYEVIRETWKKLNKVSASASASPSLQPFLRAALNITRMSQCTYQLGDGYGANRNETVDWIMSILVDPIPLNTYSPLTLGTFM